MASQARKTSIKEKLDILQKTAPHICRSLIPTQVVPKLGTLLSSDLRSRILETEEAGRREDAAKMLLDKVIEEGERGVDIFLAMLRGEGDDPGWPTILQPLENIDGIEDNESANEYFSFIVHLLEGEIIDRLTDGMLQMIIIRLLSTDAFDEYEQEMIEARLQKKGRHSAAVQMFTLLGMRDPQWPVKFFLALREECPQLYQKIAPYDVDPVIDKESSQYNTGGATACAALASLEHERVIAQDTEEQTQPKQRLTSQETQGTSGEDFMDLDEDLSSEEESCEFSDGDKEEKEDADTEKAAQPKPQSMRKYQYELATPALKGENTIICAPTGSGKTRVALYIVKEHLASAGLKGEARKVVFMAMTVPLVSQQFKIFQKYLPDFRCGMVHGQTADHELLHLMLDDFDILVITPKILENHLMKKMITSLSVFSLLIFDECHHTRKDEAYNSVMKYYLQFKKDEVKDLPQVVGLTASIGVEKASTVESAQDSIIDIMANLDVNSITKVKEHLEELSMTVPRPDEKLEELMPRADDEVSKSIRRNMVQVERLLNEQITERPGDQEFLSVRILLGKRPAERNSQKYGQWAVKICDQARKVHIPEHPTRQLPAEMIERRRLFSQNVQILAETLIAYNEALDVHELTRPVDVLDHLKRKLDPRHTADSPAPTDLEMQLLRLFKGLQKKLKSAAAAKNPNLRKLSEVIVEIMEGQWDTSRVMIFVRTRATCQALCSWLNTDENINPQLQALKASPFTGTGAHQEHGGMTQHEQEGVIEKFREGDIKLLVCTTVGQEGMDIPDCNLVIRYNHVGNEVATVQTRGRSRKAGGVSVLLAMPEVIRKERINKKRVEIMNMAIDRVNRMRAREVTNKVIKAQKLAMDKDEMKKIASMRSKNSRKKQGSFSFVCARCRKVRVPGSLIRTINDQHHVIIGNDLQEEGQVSIKMKDKPKQIDNFQLMGEFICNKCPVMRQNLLGTVLKYQEAEFLTLKAESWLMLNQNQHVEKCGKWKWKDIPYDIPGMTPEDMSVHLGLPPDYEDEDEAMGGISD